MSAGAVGLAGPPAEQPVFSQLLASKLPTMLASGSSVGGPAKRRHSGTVRGHMHKKRCSAPETAPGPVTAASAASAPWLVSSAAHVHSVQCPDCDRIFSSQLAFSEHRSAEHVSENIACPVHHCGELFSRQSVLLWHCRSQHGLAPDAVTSALQYGSIVVTDTPTGSDESDSFVTPRSAPVRTPRRGIRASPLFEEVDPPRAAGKHQCDVCNRSFETWQGLAGHKHVHTQSDREPSLTLQCKECPLTFSSRELYEAHRDAHKQRRQASRARAARARARQKRIGVEEPDDLKDDKSDDDTEVAATAQFDSSRSQMAVRDGKSKHEPRVGPQYQVNIPPLLSADEQKQELKRLERYDYSTPVSIVPVAPDTMPRRSARVLDHKVPTGSTEVVVQPDSSYPPDSSASSDLSTEDSVSDPTPPAARRRRRRRRPGPQGLQLWTPPERQGPVFIHVDMGGNAFDSVTDTARDLCWRIRRTVALPPCPVKSCTPTTVASASLPLHAQPGGHMLRVSLSHDSLLPPLPSSALVQCSTQAT